MDNRSLSGLSMESLKSEINKLKEQIEHLNSQHNSLLKLKPKANSITISVLLVIVPLAFILFDASFLHIVSVSSILLLLIPFLLIAKLSFRLYVMFKLQDTEKKVDELETKYNDLIMEKERRDKQGRVVVGGDTAIKLMGTEEIQKLASLLISQVGDELDDPAAVRDLKLSIEIKNTCMQYTYLQSDMAAKSGKVLFAEHKLPYYNEIEERQPVAQAVASVVADFFTEKYVEMGLTPDISFEDFPNNPLIGYITLVVKVKSSR